MNNISLDKIGSRATYYNIIDKNKLYNSIHSDIITNKETSELDKQEQIENKIRNVLSNSKENIKNTVPIIKNVNKQLMQDNLLMKIKIEGMKQSCKNIAGYFQNLQDQTKDQRMYNLLNDISKRFIVELENSKGE
ncbi:hypothetical protein I6U48_26745 [Clostridium sp. PL3]|uniref:Uncharacterized protein n=1 Tax=Clostridium thailandense TaxID=2794346 RepID=A0A949U4V8_9CLOT|nr:hypothetical protein [Clostridium thailandense]MBV7276479.1 hypothetical protein [Clostridium thailandense]